VVFSYWTFTLDLIEILLKEAGIKFTRIDGKQSGDQRDLAVHKLETDEEIKIILVSITCGGTGYDFSPACDARYYETPLTTPQARSHSCISGLPPRAAMEPDD
jgi:SWI/SNF-related matrix-associated actin-dependent regulator of chromatin subfamily A3